VSPAAAPAPLAAPNSAALERHYRLIDDRVQCLSRNRDAIGRYLEAIRCRQP